MATINVLDSVGSTVALEKPLTPGQAVMAASRPVVIASDQSSLPATLNAETTKVIGVVRNSDGSGNLLTSTSNALDVNIKSGANGNGRATPGNSAPVVLNSMTYKAVAASATATLLGATGATGDYLDGVLIIPATAAAGAVSITDGSGSAITIFAGGGTTALPTLAPFYVPIGAISSGGAGGWKVTTGTNVSVVGIGNFT